MSLDTYCIGEIVGNESMAFLNACCCGHRFLTTMHSNKPQDSASRLIALAKRAVGTTDEKMLTWMFCEGVDAIIHMNKFKVMEIVCVKVMIHRIRNQNITFYIGGMYDLSRNKYSNIHIVIIYPKSKYHYEDLKTLIIRKMDYLVISLSLILYVTISLIINTKINNLLTSFTVSLMPSSLPYLMFDIYKNSLLKKEKEGITGLLMVLTKWSSVKNDAVYCLQKANESSLKKPIGKYIRSLCIRLEKGMSVSDSLISCEKDALSEELRYVFINVRYAYEKGGSLYSIFKNLENQFFKIDEENYKRKISTSTDKYAVYISIILVMFTFYLIVLNNDYSKKYYFNSTLGIYILGIFSLLFFIGVLIMAKKVRE